MVHIQAPWGIISVLYKFQYVAISEFFRYKPGLLTLERSITPGTLGKVFYHKYFFDLLFIEFFDCFTHFLYLFSLCFNLFFSINSIKCSNYAY